MTLRAVDSACVLSLSWPWRDVRSAVCDPAAGSSRLTLCYTGLSVPPIGRSTAPRSRRSTPGGGPLCLRPSAPAGWGFCGRHLRGWRATMGGEACHLPMLLHEAFYGQEICWEISITSSFATIVFCVQKCNPFGRTFYCVKNELLFQQNLLQWIKRNWVLCIVLRLLTTKQWIRGQLPFNSAVKSGKLWASWPMEGRLLTTSYL